MPADPKDIDADWWREQELIPIDDSEITPYHLRPNASALCSCSQCGRQSWSDSSVGQTCGMTQPDGTACPGVMRGNESA